MFRWTLGVLRNQVIPMLTEAGMPDAQVQRDRFDSALGLLEKAAARFDQ
jgi:hypothetical protein